MSKHSPGPWKLTRYEDNEDGGGEDWFRISAKSTLELIVSSCADGYVPGENEANAHLIAAAPDLLDACRMILPVLESMKPPGLGEWNWPLLAGFVRDALAKAEGEVIQ